MPRTIEPTLRMMYERANPNYAEFVEIAQPDVGQVLRRWTDQFGPGAAARISETPASTTQPSPGGGLMLKATTAQIASIYTATATNIPLSVPDQSRILRGVAWKLDPGLKPLRIRSVTARMHVGTGPNVTYLELQIYRMRGVPGRVLNPTTGAGIVAQQILYTPTPLLPQPVRIYPFPPFVGPNTDADVTFDLSAYELDIEHRNVPAPSLLTAGEVPELLFEIWNTDPAANGVYSWLEDTASSRVVAGIGTFVDVTWDRRLPNGTIASDPNDPRAAWVRAEQAQCPCFKVNVDTYPATSQEVYAITLPRVPSAASLGRIRFIREAPLDTSATLEISTAGSGGPWTAVTHGAVVSTKQTTYHLRATLNASVDTHRSPIIEEAGIEFRIPTDVTAEVTIEPIPQDVNVPFLVSSIGEGKATVVRTGRRDYHDPASDIMAAAAATQLEVDHWLGSFHPAIGRALWFLVGRYIVTAQQDSPTSGVFSLISYAKVLKKKIPFRVESVNAVLAAVSGTTASALKVTGPLPGTTVGDEYDGLNYFIRMLGTAVVGLASGMIRNVAGNTGTTQIDLTDPLPAAPAIGDTFELHSASYQQPKLAWVNADPADVWWEILTVRLAVPSERIGLASVGRVGRAGLPPTLADRAPGDTATQDKLRVSLTLSDQEEGKGAIDQLSFIMQGTTLEIGGQIVFRPFYDLLDPTGNVVIPPEEIAATFDVRDYATLDTPRGVESRVTTMACNYGVDSSLGSDAAKPSTVVFSDADALAWFTQQDLEEIGNSSIPDEIARWCYNTHDGGLYLASVLTRQVVRAFSTGLRQWSWTTVDMHPELIVGDRVVVMTDQYVDYDPTTKVSIRGLWAFPLVLSHVARNGREFRAVMLGLYSAVPVRGGSGGVSTGLVAQPSISSKFDVAGNLLITLNMGNPPGGGFRVAASSAGLPSDATVDAATFVPGNSATVNLGAAWTAGATLQIKAFAYASSDVNGARSLASTDQAKVPGGSSANTFTSVSQGSPNYAANTIPFNWVWGGAAATFNIWVSELGSAFTHITGVTSPYTYTTSEDIRSSGGNTNDHVIFYVEAVISGVVVATSAHVDVSYRAQV